MSGWTEVRDGEVVMEHTSTSSQVVIKIKGRNLPWENDGGELWLDYSEYQSLVNCINKIEPSFMGPPEEKPKKGPHINFKTPVGFELKFFKNPAIEHGRGLVLVHPDDYESIRKNLKNQ